MLSISECQCTSYYLNASTLTFVFNRQGGNWVETQKLTASDGDAGDQFGHAVAVGGPTIVVGAPFVGNVNQGAAYVFGP